VFIDCDPNVLPWEKKNLKVGLLFQLCKKTNKALFAVGGGLLMLIYFCSTGYKNIKVLNGNEKGGSLKDIYEFTREKGSRIALNDVYLDHATGDFYLFKPVSNKSSKLINRNAMNGYLMEIQVCIIERLHVCLEEWEHIL